MNRSETVFGAMLIALVAALLLAMAACDDKAMHERELRNELKDLLGSPVKQPAPKSEQYDFNPDLHDRTLTLI
jgi:hypothetical protein